MELGIPLQEVLLKVVEILTPDGTEEQYYTLFDNAIQLKGIAVGSEQYLNVYRVASMIYIHVLDQLQSNQFVKLIMGATIQALIFNGPSTSLLLDFTPDYDECPCDL